MTETKLLENYARCCEKATPVAPICRDCWEFNQAMNEQRFAEGVYTYHPYPYSLDTGGPSMAETYTPIKIPPGKTIEEVVRDLWAYRDQGMRVCAKFNGVTLYSDTVTMDDAHQAIVGKTKAEFDAYIAWCEANKRRRLTLNARKSIQLMEKYATCPDCGNEAIGDGEGTLGVEGATFERTCKCGWRVKVDGDDKPV